MMRISSGSNVIYYKGNSDQSFADLDKLDKIHGARRVFMFCIMTTVLPTVLIIIPLYLRHVVYADVTYAVADSDVLEITKGISSFFCSGHTIEMNTTFNAFHLKNIPKVGKKKKHVRLRKSMILPDDTLEYWGFYLLKGANVYLKACSRYEGSRILVVRGERNLHTCGLMEHNFKKNDPEFDKEHNQVKVVFESAQEIETEKYANEETSSDRQFKFNNTQLIKPKKIERLKKKIPSKIKSKRKRTFKKPTSARLRKLKEELQKDEDDESVKRVKRDDVGHLFDERIEHGGNAINYTKLDSNEDGTSSFETDLFTCYNGQILLTKAFPPTPLCTDVHYLENGDRMETIHNVISDGYYYYIFYSDNDNSNDIHAVFDIYKPTLSFTNVSEAKSCINKTECEFSLSFWSNKTVIVEVPMKDGIANESDDFHILVSTCQPRMSVYIFFPVAVIFLILGCAFM